MNTEETASLVGFIVQACLAKETVLGTDLGNAIKVKFPGLNIKLKFGGLRKFIKDYCAGQVEYVRPQGGDGVYAHASKMRGTMTSDASLSTPSTAWAAFVDPNVGSQLAVDAATGALQVFAAGAQVPESLVRLDKVSLEEHRTIAKGFLPMTSESARGSFESALAESAFWRKWTATFTKFSDPEMYTSWMKWRHEQIIALLEQRLRSAGLSDEATATAIAELEKSKLLKRPSTRGMSVTPQAFTSSGLANRAPSAPDNDADTLRELARTAIRYMSGAEIRRVWLPLGAVADALRRKN